MGFGLLSALNVIDIPHHDVVGLVPGLVVYVSVSLLTGKPGR